MGELIFLNLISFLLLSGALIFWPIFRFIIKKPVEQLNGFKLQFSLQATFLSVSMFIYFFGHNASDNWLAPLFFFLIGLFGWIGAAIAFVNMNKQSKLK